VTSYSGASESFSVGVLSGKVSLNEITEEQKKQGNLDAKKGMEGDLGRTNERIFEVSKSVYKNQAVLIETNQATSFGGQTEKPFAMNELTVAEVEKIKKELPIPGENARGVDLIYGHNQEKDIYDAFSTLGMITGTGADASSANFSVDNSALFPNDIGQIPKNEFHIQFSFETAH